MSEHDEQRALDLLDARGRAAAASLKWALAQIDLEESANRLPSPNHFRRSRFAARRNVWLVAAAVLVVVGLVAAFLALRNDERRVYTGTPHEGDYLVPEWVPDGWELQTASLATSPDDPSSATADVVVYGDGGADDPWTEPHLMVSYGHNMEPYNSELADTIAVAGHPATIEEEDSTWFVEWTTDDGILVQLEAEGMSRDTVVAAAEHVTDGPAVAAEGLPAGFEELARGPLGATPFGLLAGIFGVPADGLSLVYMQSESSSLDQILVLQRPGDADDAELLRMDPGVEPVEVRGQTGFGTADVLVQWFERSTGMVITITISGGGGESDDLGRIAEGLRAAAPGEIGDLLRQHPMPDNPGG